MSNNMKICNYECLNCVYAECINDEPPTLKERDISRGINRDATQGKKAKDKAWYIAHREYKKAYRRAYYAEHRSECIARSNAYYLAHKTEQDAYRAAWKEARRSDRRESEKQEKI